MRFYRTPPQFSVDLGARMTAFLPLTVLLHLGVGAWMLSNSRFFPREDLSIAELNSAASHISSLPLASRLSQQSVLPLVLVFGLVAAASFLRGFFTACLVFWSRLFVLLTCGRCNVERTCAERVAPAGSKEADTMPPFSFARSHRLMTGVPGYNMLLNPRLAQAFALSRAFAAQ
jgi:hypothetical protein